MDIMAEKSDSDKTFCSIVEPSQEVVRVVRCRRTRFKWRKFHTTQLRSRKPPQRPPSVCSDILITTSDLRNSQLELEREVANAEPQVLGIHPSPEIVPGTQLSNKPKRPRGRQGSNPRGSRKKLIDCGVQTSPIRCNTKLEMDECQLTKLSKQLKRPVAEMKALIEKAMMADEDGNETSETDSVISNSQKSFEVPSKYQWRPSEQHILIHKSPKAVATEQVPAVVPGTPKRPFFTPIPSTPVRPPVVRHQQRQIETTIISPRTYYELTQSPTNRISRIKLNFSSVRVSPKAVEIRQSFRRPFAARRAKHHLALQLFDDDEVQSSHCTSTVFDDDNKQHGRNENFFLDDSLDLFC